MTKKRQTLLAAACILPPVGCLIGAALFSNDRLWLAAKYLLTLVAPCWVLFVSGLHGEQEAALPFYRQMNRRTMRGMAFFYVLSLVLYSSAVLLGLEPGWEKWIVIAVNGTFLMTVGLTWKNMTGKAFVGGLAAAAYCALCAFGGAALGEQMWFVSVSVNMEVYTKILWDNLIYLTALSIILYACNAMYVGRKENPHRFVMGGMLTAVVIIMLINLPQISGYAGEQYQSVSENGYTLRYENEISEETASELLQQWIFIQEHFKPYLGEDMLQYEALCARTENIPEHGDGMLHIPYQYLAELNPPRYCKAGGCYRAIAETVLDNAGLASVPQEMREGWYEYMIHAVLTQSVVELYPPQYLKRYFPACYQPEAYEPYLNRIIKQKTAVDQAAYALYFTETKYGTGALRELFQSIAGGAEPKAALVQIGGSEMSDLLA